MTPLVSIIIPAYNSEKYLAEAIQSALDQTWKNTEVIIVDDGSTDGSLAVAKTFASEKIKVFYQENRGAGAARNRGLREAKGDYIQFLDGDDLICPNKIETQIMLLAGNPGYICFCPTVYFNDNEDHKSIAPIQHWINNRSDDPVDFLIKLYGGALVGPQYGGLVTIHAWLCPRSVLDKAGPWNEELSLDDDGEYFCRVMLASKGILYIEGVFNYYRKHSQFTNLSASKSSKGYQSLIKSIDLKFVHLYGASANKEIVKKIFARIYNDYAVNTYPLFKDFSGYAINKAKALWQLKPEYKAGPVSNVLVKMLGWRAVRRLNYYRHGF